MEQVLLTREEHTLFNRVCVAQYLVFCVVFCGPWHCMFIFDLPFFIHFVIFRLFLTMYLIPEKANIKYIYAICCQCPLFIANDLLLVETIGKKTLWKFVQTRLGDKAKTFY